MNFFRIASQSKLTAFAALAAGGVLLAACDSTVEGGSGTGGAGGGESSATGVSQGGGPVESSSVSAAGGASPGGANAIAVRASDLGGVGGGSESVSVSVGAGGSGGWEEGSTVAAVGAGGYGTTVAAVSVGVGVGGSSGEGGYSSTGVGGGGPSPDPDALVLFISNDLVECVDPFGVDESCGARQVTATINLPLEYQQVGTYSLSDEALNAFFSEWQGDGNICEGGGGSFWDGTLEVLSITDSIIQVRLSGTSPADLDGLHDVLRCSSGPTPEASSALAFFPSDLPPDPGTGPASGTSVTTTGVGGSGPGEESLILDFADHGQVCADPFGDQPGPGQTFEDFLIYLPQSYLVPGTYSLEDPAITTGYQQMSDNTGVASGGPGGNPGTLTIFEVTDSFIDLELEGTQYDFANGAGQVPRCN